MIAKAAYAIVRRPVRRSPRLSVKTIAHKLGCGARPLSSSGAETHPSPSAPVFLGEAGAANDCSPIGPPDSSSSPDRPPAGIASSCLPDPPPDAAVADSAPPVPLPTITIEGTPIRLITSPNPSGSLPVEGRMVLSSAPRSLSLAHAWLARLEARAVRLRGLGADAGAGHDPSHYSSALLAAAGAGGGGRGDAAGILEGMWTDHRARGARRPDGGDYVYAILGTADSERRGRDSYVAVRTRVRELLEEMDARDVEMSREVYHAAMSAVIVAGREDPATLHLVGDGVAEMYGEMTERGITPDRATFRICLSGLAPHYGRFERDEARWWIMKMEQAAEAAGDEDLRPTTEDWNAALPRRELFGGELGYLTRMDEFVELGSANKKIMKNAECAQRMGEWLLEMEDAGERARPNINTYEPVIRAWVRTGTREGLERAETWARRAIDAYRNGDTAVLPRLATFHPILCRLAHVHDPASPERVEGWLDTLQGLHVDGDAHGGAGPTRLDAGAYASAILTWNRHGRYAGGEPERVADASVRWAQRLAAAASDGSLHGPLDDLSPFELAVDASAPFLYKSDADPDSDGRDHVMEICDQVDRLAEEGLLSARALDGRQSLYTRSICAWIGERHSRRSVNLQRVETMLQTCARPTGEVAAGRTGATERGGEPSPVSLPERLSADCVCDEHFDYGLLRPQNEFDGRVGHTQHDLYRAVIAFCKIALPRSELGEGTRASMAVMERFRIGSPSYQPVDCSELYTELISCVRKVVLNVSEKADVIRRIYKTAEECPYTNMERLKEEMVVTQKAHRGHEDLFKI